MKLAFMFIVAAEVNQIAVKGDLSFYISTLGCIS